jgi:peptidoglycan/LPS O-acetylase OafA/YrhL
MIIVGFTGIAILGGCFILIASYAPPAFLFNAVLRRFGTYAYCLYLVHQPLGILMHWAILGRAQSIVDLPRDCVTLLSLALLLVVAALSWRFFEAPLVSIGREMRYETTADVRALKTTVS